MLTANIPETGVAILISDKADFQARTIIRNKDPPDH